MRIISGARKGKLLHTLEGLATRPMPDMAKGAIFNIVRSRVPRARVLDLFCGTGTLGMECLSLGAAHVTFVDAGVECIPLLKRNIHSIQAETLTTIIAAPAGKALAQLSRRTSDAGRFELAFLDPPFAFMKQFNAPMGEDPLSMAGVVAAVRELLVPGGALILRYESGDAMAPIEGFTPLSARNPARRYGRSTVAIMLRAEDGSGAKFEFPRDEEFRGHRPKNMGKLAPAGNKAESEADGDDDSEPEAGTDEAMA